MVLNIKRRLATNLHRRAAARYVSGSICLSLLLSLGMPALAQLQTVQTPSGPLVIPYPQVPTDVTGIGGSLGAAQGLRHLLLGPDRNTLPNTNFIVARDPRYSFTGIWMPIEYGQARMALAPDGVRTLAAVVPVAVPERTSMMDRLDAAITPGDLDATLSSSVPQIMPTCGADYSVCGGNEITLANGALLIKVGDRPVYVSSGLCGNGISVQLANGAFAMVSALNGKFVVANLADSAPNSVVLTVGDKTRCDSGSIPIRVGHLAELHANGVACSENELVAYTIPNTIPMTDGLTLEVMRLSYPRTLKRFNLTRNLTSCDLRRVMKTAAAVSYVDREREWNGMELYAP